MTRLDLTEYEVIDNHCHPFPVGREPKDFARNACIGLYPVESEDMRNTVYYHMLMNELRRYFDMKDASDEEVIEVRNAHAIKDREAYTKALYREAGYSSLLVDFGYPIGQKYDKSKKLSEAEIREMHDCCEPEIRLYNINRIEWVANRLVEEMVPFRQFEQAFYDGCDRMVKDEGLIALKSVIAYYTGLEVKVLEKEDVRKGYEAYLRDPTDQKAEKVFRDYTFLLGCNVARMLDIPLQIHTGLGDSPDCNLLKCNPFLLHEVINLPQVRETKLMLIHGSYPYMEELGMLLNHYTNIYADISSFCPYAGMAAEDKLLKLFEMAPLNKVCFGTDGCCIPEHTWFGAIFMKRVLAEALDRLVERGHISYDFAERSARNILSENVKRIYKL
ncbi:MAG: amidohydrolase family protein [Clostridia bacterium]|nr:amidohydrolase family protein [Clostridia bacterium]MBQ5955940.1 amidohydrolase family protein [Clostridia bacterium]